MSLMKCPECSIQVSDKAVSCPSCGYPIGKLNENQSSDHAPATPSNIRLAPQAVNVTKAGVYTVNDQPILPAPQTVMVTVTVIKNRGIHIILGLLFGGMGFHNFYSGHNLRGAIKIGVFLIAFGLDASTGFYSAFSLVVFVIFGFWALVEVITVKSDASGNPMS